MTYHRLFKTAKYGACFGAIFAVWALLLSVFSGDATIVLRSGRRISAVWLAAAYVFCGSLGGLIVAVLAPLARWRLGAFLVGALAIAPIAGSVGLLLTGFGTRWEAAHTFAVAVTILLLGGPLGLHGRSLFRKDLDDLHRSSRNRGSKQVSES